VGNANLYVGLQISCTLVVLGLRKNDRLESVILAASDVREPSVVFFCVLLFSSILIDLELCCGQIVREGCSKIFRAQLTYNRASKL